jgi:hypothetical protein
MLKAIRADEALCGCSRHPSIVARCQSACFPSAEEGCAKGVKRRCLRRGHGCSCFVGSARPPAQCGGAPVPGEVQHLPCGFTPQLATGGRGVIGVPKNGAHWERFSWQPALPPHENAAAPRCRTAQWNARPSTGVIQGTQRRQKCAQSRLPGPASAAQ